MNPRATGMCEKQGKLIPRKMLPIPLGLFPHRSVRKLVTTRCTQGQADQALRRRDDVFLDPSSPHIHKHAKNVNLNKNALILFQPI